MMTRKMATNLIGMIRKEERKRGASFSSPQAGMWETRVTAQNIR
jgi:hypothetical protein